MPDTGAADPLRGLLAMEAEGAMLRALGLGAASRQVTAVLEQRRWQHNAILLREEMVHRALPRVEDRFFATLCALSGIPGPQAPGTSHAPRPPNDRIRASAIDASAEPRDLAKANRPQ
jgi:hypothetical protein